MNAINLIIGHFHYMCHNHQSYCSRKEEFRIIIWNWLLMDWTLVSYNLILAMILRKNSFIMFYIIIQSNYATFTLFIANSKNIVTQFIILIWIKWCSLEYPYGKNVSLQRGMCFLTLSNSCTLFNSKFV